MTGQWNDAQDRGMMADLEERVGTIVGGLLRLASDDDACRILGIDGTLEDEVDLMFLADPLAWIASEIANAIQSSDLEDEDEDEEEVAGGQASLSTLVALVRLYRTLRGTAVDERELRDAVIIYATGEDAEEE
jgi:hypothetical protein